MVVVNAWSRSQMMSSTSSIPTEMRTRSSGIPAATSCSADSCWWVVEPGCNIKVLASPILAKCDANCKFDMKSAVAWRPPFTPKLNTQRQQFPTAFVVRVVFQTGVVYVSDPVVFIQPFGDLHRVSQVLIHALWQRFHTDHQLECRLRWQGRTKVAQLFVA